MCFISKYSLLCGCILFLSQRFCAVSELLQRCCVYMYCRTLRTDTCSTVIVKSFHLHTKTRTDIVHTDSQLMTLKTRHTELKPTLYFITNSNLRQINLSALIFTLIADMALPAWCELHWRSIELSSAPCGDTILCCGYSNWLTSFTRRASVDLTSVAAAAAPAYPD